MVRSVKKEQLDRQLQLFDLEGLVPCREARIAAAGRLADAISARLTEPVRLVVHDNRSTMVSFRRRPGVLHYRVHHMFLDAPDEVVDALAVFASSAQGRGSRRRRAAGSRIDAFVRGHRWRIGTPRQTRIKARGQVHDLQAIFDRLNTEYFGGAVEASVGWGAWRGGRCRRTIKTGVYVQESRLIRIHPRLDCQDVPEFYVAAVVHHEMLHQVIPAEETRGRRVVHGKEFRRRERAYPDYHRARAWEEANLSLLLGRD